MSTRSSRTKKRLFLLLVAGLALAASACGSDGNDLPQNALDPQGPFARQLDNLFDPVFAVATVVFVFVQGLIIYSVVRFRAKSDDDAPKQVHGNARAEISWTIVPALILAVVAVFTVVTIFDINRRAEGAEVVQVKVIGHQWWWEYEYPELGVVTANEMHIPAGRTVQLAMTSEDVIHSFWPPKLAGKVDVVPGRVNYMKVQADEPGDYSGQCAEFCGLSHANMRLRVIADSPADFDAWVANQQRSSVAAPATTTTTAPPATTTGTATLPTGPKPGDDPRADAGAGAGLFVTKGCTACHMIDGLEGANGQIAPNLTHFAARGTFAGAVFDNNEKNLRKWLRNPPLMKPMAPENGQGMPNLGLSGDEITQLIAYLETLK